jgi:hypothetical protein
MPVLPMLALGVRYRFGRKTLFTVQTYSVKLPPEYRSLKMTGRLIPKYVELIPHGTTYVT